MLNLRFKAPQGRGPLQDDRAYKKILACRIWRVAVQYASSHGQNTCFFLCFCTYSWPYPSDLASPMLVNPSKLIFFNHCKHTEHIYCIVICPENIISSNFFPFRKWTRKNGKQYIFNSQYLASLPFFNPYIYTICSVCIIEPTKVHLSTIYSISQGALSLNKIVNLWRRNQN